jgi:hypothetical protein
MKIGIMTFWWSDDNYGQILQCYALQKYLRDAGHDAYLIRYDPRGDYEKKLWDKVIRALNPIELFFYLQRRIRNKKIIKKNKLRKFNEFRDKYIRQSERIYYHYNDLVPDPPEADVYIAGSDQIWNIFSLPIQQVKKRLRAYFLDFGKPDIKRIAYAASFGKETVGYEFSK